MARRAWRASATGFFPAATMPEGLFFADKLPLAWRADDLDTHARLALLREAAFLLNALNQMEGAPEADTGDAEHRRLDRLEAKLDLALYLLARNLEAAQAVQFREVILAPDRVEWREDQPPAPGSPLILELRLAERLPLTLRLPARACESRPGYALVRLENLPEALDDALHQFVFRRHRQAIRARAAS